MKKYFIFFLLSILLVSCFGFFSVSASDLNLSLLNPYSYAGDPEGTPTISFVATHKNSYGSYDRCFLLDKYGDVEDLSSTDGVWFKFHDLIASDNNSLFCRYNYYINNLNMSLVSRTFDCEDLNVNSIKQVKIITSSSSHQEINGLTFSTLSAFVSYAADGLPFAGGDVDPIYNTAEGSLPLIIEIEFGEVIYTPPYSPGEIESGYQDVVSGLEGIDSDLTLETLSPDHIGSHIGGHIGINSEVNAVGPLRNFLNNGFVITLLLTVFSFATVSYVLFGKKA